MNTNIKTNIKTNVNTDKDKNSNTNLSTTSSTTSSTNLSMNENANMNTDKNENTNTNTNTNVNLSMNANININHNCNRKTFILDTNVLIHNPRSLFSFDDNIVAIPFDVLEELDKLKNGNEDVNRNARQTIRFLDSLRQKGELSKGVPVNSGKGLVIVALNGFHHIEHECLKTENRDNSIIKYALHLHESGKKVVLISKDINVRIKADALGLQVQDYESQKVNFSSLYCGYKKFVVDDRIIEDIYDDKEVAAIKVTADTVFPNEYLELVDQHDVNNFLLAQVNAEKNLSIVEFANKPVFGVMPLNIQQRMALDLLLDDSVRLVTLIGSAGTGKTLLALAAGMFKVLKERSFKKLLCARPIMPMGRDIGYLPGTKDEKLSLWMQPIFDNLAYLLSHKLNNGPVNVDKEIQKYVESGEIVMEPLTYIRGRSIPNQFMIIDEAQNLTPHEVKTIVSRAGQGTKVILTGDATQIDNPYLDSESNGLSYIVDRLKDNAITGHITLQKSERSELAQLISDQL